MIAVPFQLEIGRRMRAGEGRRSVSETFCNTWTQFFWGVGTQKATTALQHHRSSDQSVWIIVGAHHDHDHDHDPAPQSPQAEKARQRQGKTKTKARQAKIPARRLLPLFGHSTPLQTPDLIRSSSSKATAMPPPCSPSAYPRTVFRIISVSSSLTLLI
jgi:hypothetical protein